MSGNSTEIIELRCKLCNTGIVPVQHLQKVSQCLECGQQWKIKWFTADNQPMIISPLSWLEYQNSSKWDKWGGK